MATYTTVVGNLTAKPTIRKTKSGLAVTNFVIAETTRVRDSDGNWDDGNTSFYRVSVWKQLAKNVAASLKKGQQVIVKGRLEVREYEDDEGENRKSVDVTADTVGVSLQFGTAQFSKGGAKSTSVEEEEETEEEVESKPKSKSKKKASSASTRSKTSAGVEEDSMNDLFQ